MIKLIKFLPLLLVACTSGQIAPVESDIEVDNVSAEELVLRKVKSDAEQREQARQELELKKQEEDKKRLQIVNEAPKIIPAAEAKTEVQLAAEKATLKDRLRLALKADPILKNFPDTYHIEPPVINANNQRMVIYFHDDNGMSDRSLDLAFELATAGLHVIHYCWYNCGKFEVDDLSQLKDINIQTIANNLKFLMAIKRLKFNSFTLIGSGRGAELVSLLASMQKELGIHVDATVLISAPAKVQAPRRKITRVQMNKIIKNPESETPRYVISGNVWMTDTKDIATDSEIEINRYSGPLLILHGTGDKKNSSENAKQLKKKYEENGKTAEVLLLTDENHQLTRAGQDLAVAKILRFLEK